MTAHQTKSINRTLTLNNILMALLVPTIIWFGSKQVDMYNAYLKQPGIDEKQDTRIEAIGKELGSHTMTISSLQLQVSGQEKKIAVINNNFPQTKIEDK